MKGEKYIMKSIEEEVKKGRQILRSKFIEPPFSVLDTKGGYWKERKNKWKSIGILGEIGRGENLTGLNSFNNNNNYESRKNYTGTSIFDPVLCELMYSWFSEEGDKVLDPFAGGSVRGIVANSLKRIYTGIELREEQVKSNKEQSINILDKNNQPVWIIGDSNKVLDNINVKYDMIFSCPPYSDLEVYSDLEGDLSNMDYDNFIKSYDSIIKKSCNLLKNKGFACFVVGDIRDKDGYYRGFVADTIKIFNKYNMKLYNDAILLENGLNTAAMRADRYMKSKKLVKVHQNVLIFKKDE
jgi:DNA modification methylase